MYILYDDACDGVWVGVRFECYINGSLGRVIDTKLFRTHLSRDGADCRRIIRRRGILL